MDEVKIAWLNSISHNLNTPATAMKMLVDGMTDGIFKPNKHNLKDLQVQNDTLSRRIQKVIDYSTLVAETKPDIMEYEAKFITQNLENVTADIRIDTFACDKNLMSRAVNELINNAFEFGTDVRICIEKENNNYKITVSDKGNLPINFSAGSLFEPWTKGDSSRTNGGNGLGLPIVSAIASLHNGKAELVQDNDTVKASITWPAN